MTSSARSTRCGSSRPRTTSPVRSGWRTRSRGSRQELEERLAELEGQGKLLEAQRLRMRTNYDVEMMKQVGFCSGHRELLAPHRRPRRRNRAGHPDRLLPRRLPDGHRRVARHGAADRRHVRGRHVAQAQPGRLRLPAAVGRRQPAADLGGVRRPHRADGVPVGDAGSLRAEPGRRRVRRAGHPARPGWSTRRSSSSPPRARSTT